MRKHLAILGFAFIAGACDNSISVAPRTDTPLEPALITLAPSSMGVMTAAGDSRTITAVVKNNDGGIVASPNVQWSSSDPNVVAVVNNGSDVGITIVAVKDGNATITARSGSAHASLDFSVHQVMVSISIGPLGRALEYGASTQLVAVAFDARHNAIPNVQGYKFSSDHPSIAFVQPNGLLTALFKFPQLSDAVITASLSRDGITATARTSVIITEPLEVDFGALMLTEYVEPVRPPTLGSGIALMTRTADRINARIVWSDLTGPATSVLIRGPGTLASGGELLVNLGPLPQLDSIGVINGSITSANIRSQNGRAPISLDSLGSLMCNRQALIEVHTGRFPNGEIRGLFTCFQ